jgi:dihydropteroate synthase
MFAGLRLDRPRLMAVINVTPDSFSDAGDYFDSKMAIAAGRRFLDEGADILDVGGESTRPGAVSVPIGEELRRVVPVVEALAREGALVSIDTRHPAVMTAALAVGARIINDVTALTGDERSLSLVAASGASVVLMHMQGDPRTMQDAPRYRNVVNDVTDWLRQRVETCRTEGIGLERIAIDPGIGFGKTVAHNVQILAGLESFAAFGCGLLVGVSRKSFIGRLSAGESPKSRLPGSLAAALAAVERGAQILRVHDVAETRQALRVWSAIAAAE